MNSIITQDALRVRPPARDYSTSTTSGNSLQVTKTDTNSVQVFSTNDPIDHFKDNFYIWVHPSLNYSQAHPGDPIDVSFVASNVQNLMPLVLDANELTGKELIPSDKQAQLLDLTPQDLAQIATADLFLNPAYQMDTNRFQHVDSLPLVGPDYPGMDPSEMPFSVSNASTSCKTDAEGWTDTVSVGFSAGGSFFGLGEQAQVVKQITWAHTSTVGDCTGNVQTASYTPHSTTTFLGKDVEVYEDGVFHTFLFVEPAVKNHSTTISALSDVLSDTAGRPLASQLIVVALPDGTNRKLHTDSKGDFTIVQVPVGQIKITSGALSRAVTVAMGQTNLGSLALSRSAGEPLFATMRRVPVR
jgi:hypothetical protein